MFLMISSILAAVVASSLLVCIGVARVSELPRTYIIGGTLASSLLYLFDLVAKEHHILLTDLTILAVAIFAGAYFGGQISSMASFAALAISASVADLFSFHWGLTGKIIAASQTGASHLLERLSVAIPSSSGNLIPIVGIGDLFMVALFSAAMRNLGKKSAAIIVPTTGLLAALCWGLLIGGIFAVPFVAGATLIYLLWMRYAKGTESSRYTSSVHC